MSNIITEICFICLLIYAISCKVSSSNNKTLKDEMSSSASTPKPVNIDDSISTLETYKLLYKRANAIFSHSNVTAAVENIKTEGSTDSGELGTIIESDVEVSSVQAIEEAATSKPINVTIIGTNGTRKTTTEYKEPYNMQNTLKDIAYYLRAYKFNEYDRRYETDSDRAPRNYFKEFPRPPLRSLHWEVHKYCEPSFLECIDYLRKKIRYTSLKRSDDSAIIMQDQKWSLANNSLQIKQVNDECKKMKKIGDIVAEPFQGPLERFQWRVTASYFMCWYTMKQTPQLRSLSDNCDNFANCLEGGQGPNNRDVRAKDSNPYSCALYSFCPDPCCPIKHLDKPESCWDSSKNPCFRGNDPGHRECFFNRSGNTEFKDIILNRWNVTCTCPPGHDWNSRFGMCVDADECALGSHNCDSELQGCVNVVGGFRCSCIWGHTWNPATNQCSPSKALRLIKLSQKEDGEDEGGKSQSLIWRMTKFFRRNCANISQLDKIFSNLLCALLFILK